MVASDSGETEKEGRLGEHRGIYGSEAVLCDIGIVSLQLTKLAQLYILKSDSKCKYEIHLIMHHYPLINNTHNASGKCY